jgi:hypothetical protein
MHHFPIGSVKRVICVSLALMLWGTQMGVSRASPLAPGGFIGAPAEVNLVGASLLASISNHFSSASFSGSLVSSVSTGDTSNPYGATGLTFAYLIFLDALSPDALSSISIGSFTGFQTDVSYQTPTVGMAPFTISRNPTGSQSVNFNFTVMGGTNNYLLPGNNSAYLVVQTDATAWHFDTASVIDNVGTAVTTISPTSPVPEPTSVTFFLLGIGALVCSWRLRLDQQS